MKCKSTRTGISRQDLAQDRAFWRDLLAGCTGSRGLPAHRAGGYRNRAGGRVPGGGVGAVGKSPAEATVEVL